MRPQPWAQGRSIVEHLWPLDALLARVGPLPTFLCELGQRSRQVLPPRLERTEWAAGGLLGSQQALVVPLAALAPRQ